MPGAYFEPSVNSFNACTLISVEIFSFAAIW
jgi:hypothetical protein